MPVRHKGAYCAPTRVLAVLGQPGAPVAILHLIPEMHYLKKISVAWHSGGPLAVGRLLFRRAIFRRWESVLFSADSVVSGAGGAWPVGYDYRWYARRGDLSLEECDRLLLAGAKGFLADLSSDDALYVVWLQGEAASWGAVPRKTRQRVVLGLPGDAHLIGSCETRIAHRGRGLYRGALIRTVEALRSAGKQPIFIEVLEDNAASISAIEKAGFRRLGHVDTRIFFGCMVLRDGAWSYLHQSGRS